ncbi:MAG: hypothetical protein JNK82_19895 [Myxococcaceae bacterium]|nr:hypothetical protein [Myxococcaceae bacterium]
MNLTSACCASALVLVCCGVSTATSTDGEPLADEGRRLEIGVEPRGGGSSEDAGRGSSEDAGRGGSEDAGRADAGTGIDCIEETEIKDVDGKRCECTKRVCLKETKETRGACTQTKTSGMTTYVCKDVATGEVTVSATMTTDGLNCSAGCTNPYKDPTLPAGATAVLDTVSTTNVSVNGRPVSSTTGVTATWSGPGGRTYGWFTPPAPGNDLSTCF